MEWQRKFKNMNLTLKGLMKALPSARITETARCRRENGVREMELIFNMLDQASYGGRAL